MSYPERLNLAIANKCLIACPGCYQQFGVHGPNLQAFEKVVMNFLSLGINKVTISGGDPLTIDGLTTFLNRITKLGVQEVKLDTVGVTLIGGSRKSDNIIIDRYALTSLLECVDILGIPMDGWDNESIYIYRKGRKHLFSELYSLLKLIDSLSLQKKIIINTVAHKKNIEKLSLIYMILIEFKCISEWHIFQYTPSDQASHQANQEYFISEKDFLNKKKNFYQTEKLKENKFDISFYSIEDRLGKYLLINSDGNAWLPDRFGKTINLGSIFNNEIDILNSWKEIKVRLI